MSKVQRIIDSNINRISEGLRVLEDISRFILELPDTTANIRNIRHEIRTIFSDKDLEFLKARDSVNDIGKNISQEDLPEGKKPLQELITSNFKRVQEGLRSIEESVKNTDQYTKSKQIENLRFRTYNLEKSMTPELVRPKLPAGIYGLTAEKYSKGRNNIQVVKKMIRGGVNIVQYREKHNSKSFKEMYQECKKIRKITRKNNVLFLINDYIQLAEIVDADGVHIGQDDLPYQEVRKTLSFEKIIGISTHKPEQARKAVEQGADYIGVGPIFPTDTKENVCESVGLDYLDWVEENIEIPYVTIGGIKEHNIERVKQHGAQTFALVTEIVGAEDITAQVERLVRKINN